MSRLTGTVIRLPACAVRFCGTLTKRVGAVEHDRADAGRNRRYLGPVVAGQFLVDVGGIFGGDAAAGVDVGDDERVDLAPGAETAVEFHHQALDAFDVQRGVLGVAAGIAEVADDVQGIVVQALVMTLPLTLSRVRSMISLAP